MSAIPASRFVRVSRVLPAVAAIGVGVCALLVLTGWLLEIEFLKSLLHPGRVAMNPVTALCFILCAVSLWMMRDEQHRHMRIVRGLAAAVVLIGALRLLGYAWEWEFGPDRMLFRSRLSGNVMAPNTAIAFMLMGTALALFDWRTPSGWHASQLFTLAAGCIAVLALTGYLFNILTLYGMKGYIPMALNTAMAFTLLMIGILSARPRREPMATLLDDTLGGVVARRLLPAAFLLPLILGWLYLMGVRHLVFSNEFGLSLLVLGIIVILNTLIWWSAQILRRTDARRREAEQLLQSQYRLLDEAARSEREAHAALKSAQSQLVQTEKLASLGQMVAGVAHEINNPLAFVSNNVAVLQRDLRALVQLLKLYEQAANAPPQQVEEIKGQIHDLAERIDLVYTLANLEELLTRSRDGLSRIQQIVKDLREFARLDAADLQESDVNAGIESTINIVRGLAKKKQVTLDLELAALPRMRCYPAKINQVVMNLVTNAIDACGTGGRVTVRSAAGSNGEIRVEVSDTGHGIPPEIRDRIFDPFFTTKKIGEGTGLGLSISYGIIKDHGGRIEVDSEVGKGSRFTVTLPRQHIAPAQQATDRG
jgi:two-component system NtrC family sensor kinase